MRCKCKPLIKVNASKVLTVGILYNTLGRRCFATAGSRGFLLRRIFRFHDRLIAYNHRAFDRGVPLVQLDFPAERIKRVLEKAAAGAKTGAQEPANTSTAFSSGDD